jgi:hypothetical protein
MLHSQLLYTPLMQRCLQLPFADYRGALPEFVKDSPAMPAVAALPLRLSNLLPVSCSLTFSCKPLHSFLIYYSDFSFQYVWKNFVSCMEEFCFICWLVITSKGDSTPLSLFSLL